MEGSAEAETTGKGSEVSSKTEGWSEEGEEIEEMEEEEEEGEEAEEESEDDEDYLEEEWSSEEALTTESTLSEDKKQQTEDSSSIEKSDYTISQKSFGSDFSKSHWELDEADECDDEESSFNSRPPTMKKVITFHPRDMIYNRERLRKSVYVHKLSDPVPQELLYLAGCIGYRQEETDRKKWLKRMKIEQVLFGSKDRGERIRNIIKERKDVRWRI